MKVAPFQPVVEDLKEMYGEPAIPGRVYSNYQIPNLFSEKFMSLLKLPACG